MLQTGRMPMLQYRPHILSVVSALSGSPDNLLAGVKEWDPCCLILSSICHNDGVAAAGGQGQATVLRLAKLCFSALIPPLSHWHRTTPIRLVHLYQFVLMQPKIISQTFQSSM